MWMGLTSRNSSLATLKTILFVQIIPWFVISIGSMVLVPLMLLPRLLVGGGGPPNRFFEWYPLLITAVATLLGLGKNAGFLLWARGRLFSRFRQRASQELASASAQRPIRTSESSVPPLITTA